MNILMLSILIALVILIILVLILLFKRPYEDLSAKIDLSLKEQFLTFQTNLYNELNSTKEIINNSKDKIYEQTIQTVKAIGSINSTIQQIIQQQEEVQKIGQSLKDILQMPKLRGNFGEFILEEMLEKILPPGMWEKQYTIENGQRVDAVIKYKDIIIPIDAKFPKDNYQKYLESPTNEEKEKYWKEFEKSVIDKITDISKKYIKQDKGTSDFALMFIPSEAIFYETIAQKNSLGKESNIYKKAMENKVIPVSPNTFYAFLHIVLMGIKNIEILKNVKKLQENLNNLQKHFNKFYKNYEDIGKVIEKINDNYKKGNTEITKYKDMLDKILKLEFSDINIIESAEKPDNEL
ncbi:MAG: hypothetical protein KatS3mg068_2677 [Candidatus Sericytochromatia bacterium]|nr:MAG: hypothetical protein KatS3mg068_2677 [Candidatus Sericytochromatia bacterium]GIX42029.1 MAG: hypothetical protein KatS3mg129_1762 [Leptospiraceae bacterium]